MGDAKGMEIPEAAKNLVMHVAIKIGNDILMGSDTMPGQPFSKGTNNYISIFQILEKKPTDYLMSFQQAETPKCQ